MVCMVAFAMRLLVVKNAIRKIENNTPVEDVLSELAHKISNKFLHNAYVALNDQSSEKYSEIKVWIKFYNESGDVFYKKNEL